MHFSYPVRRESETVLPPLSSSLLVPKVPLSSSASAVSKTDSSVLSRSVAVAPREDNAPIRNEAATENAIPNPDTISGRAAGRKSEENTSLAAFARHFRRP